MKLHAIQLIPVFFQFLPEYQILAEFSEFTLNLKLHDVPIDMAKESTPVLFTKSSTSSDVYVWCSACTSSSIPANTPNSSTVTSYL